MGKVLVINNADFSDVAVKQVTFQRGCYINVIASLNEASSLVSGSGFYPIGSTATISATSDKYCTFVKWSDGNTNAERTVTITYEGTLVLVAEYVSNIVIPNNFIWGNGGIMTPGVSSGSLNSSASTITKFIHTITECTMKISNSYLDRFCFSSYAYSDSYPDKSHLWQDQGNFILWSGDYTHKEIILPAGIYTQIGIKTIDQSSFTSDLSICANVVGYIGKLELVS